MLPMIFIEDQFIGGYDQLVALERSGQLAARCAPASSA
jgi:glutaredoxin